MEVVSYRPSAGDCPSNGMFGLLCIADGTNAATITVRNSKGVTLMTIVTKQPLSLFGPIRGGDTQYSFTASGTGGSVLFFEAII
jgi:hypothetical protein